MVKVRVIRQYDSVSRDPATRGQPVVALQYSIDDAGAFELRLLRTPGWETRVDAAVRADAVARLKMQKLAFDI